MQSLYAVLLRAEQAVAGITQPGQYIAVSVELSVESGNVNFYVGMGDSHLFDPLGRTDYRHKFNIFTTALFERVQRVDGGTARCEHRVYQKTVLFSIPSGSLQ